MLKATLTLLATIALRGAGVAQGTYTQIDVPGSLFTVCQGINQAGDVVGQYEDSHGSYHGFILADGVYSTIDYPGANGSGLYGINDFGKIVGVADNFGFLFDVRTQEFTKINFPYAASTYATSINNAGWIVGFAQFNGRYARGFALIGSNYFPTKLSFGNEYIYGINSAGEMVGYAQAGKLGSYSYYKGQYQQISIPGVSSQQTLGINDAGAAVVGVGNTGGFLYQGGILELLQFGSYGVTPRGVNNGGEVVGHFLDSGYREHGFTWAPFNRVSVGVKSR